MKKMPDKNITGYYRHYKHNPAEGAGNYTYEVLSDGTHTEKGEKFVIYRALYGTGEYWLRPFEMFFENVEKDGTTFPRFTQITDPAIITELEKIRDKMYGSR